MNSKMNVIITWHIRSAYYLTLKCRQWILYCWNIFESIRNIHSLIYFKNNQPVCPEWNSLTCTHTHVCWFNFICLVWFAKFIAHSKVTNLNSTGNKATKGDNKKSRMFRFKKSYSSFMSLSHVFLSMELSNCKIVWSIWK